MSTPLFSVRPSGIHGLGLFATQFIPAGTELGALEGEPTTQDGPYVLWLDESQGFRVENDLKYINHDREPNAAYYDDLTVATIADIQPGQEITHHYDGDDAEFGNDDATFDDFEELVHDKVEDEHKANEPPAGINPDSPNTADLIA